MKTLLALCLVLASACVHAEAPAEAPIPEATAALAAYESFMAAPLDRLEHTLPFLAFIRDSGAVHIVLNNDLLAWMYEPMDPAVKAALYAAFLGGNMAEQLKAGSAGAADIAGMASALDVYAAVKQVHPDFRLAQFEQLAAARAADGLGAAVGRIVNGAEPRQ